jgi:type II secretory ATPase GspE/PulE/Tfp pilus assembly ATPase PilB-like protein
MGIEPFLIASTVKAVVGQRLVRRLCTNCRQSHPPTPDETSTFMKLFRVTKSQGFSAVHELEQQAAKQAVGGDTPLSTTPEGITTIWQANPEGCEECHHTGYKGRIGIYEVLGISIPVQKMIMADATSQQIQDQAISEGMITMMTDGLVKALRGNTTIQEVLRATKE